MGPSGLDAALDSIERVLLDTSTLIAFHSPHERVHPLSIHLMGRIQSDTDPLRGYYSAISAAELLVRPVRTGVENFTHMQDFLTGFVIDDKEVWGRPVGVTVDKEGALLVSEDAAGTIWRVTWEGGPAGQ